MAVKHCQRIAEQWDEFAHRFLPKDCPDHFRKAMRGAFYKGASAVLFGVVWKFDHTDEPTEDDMQIMEDLYQELRDFQLASTETKCSAKR